MKNLDDAKVIFMQPDFWLRFLLAVVVTMPTGQILRAAEQQLLQQRTDYFKLISTVEYSAKRGSESKQYRHQAEPWFMVTTAPQSKQETHYNLLTTEFKFQNEDAVRQYSNAGEINYDLTDRRYMAGVDDDLVHLQRMNNECIKTLDGKAVNEVGKTWTCRFNLDIFNHYSLPKELKFTVTSIKVKTDELGDLMAVRAISDPFMVKAAQQIEGYGYVKCRIASVYLFDPYVPETNAEDIYVSAMVFLAATKMDDMVQEYRYEFGTYKTDANAVPIDMNGLGMELEAFVREIRLIPSPMEEKDPVGLPYWAQSEVVNAAQIATTCAAVACEQSVVNPVASIYLAAARTYELQNNCLMIQWPCPRSVCQALRYDVEEIYPMDICGDKPIALWWLAAVPIAAASYHKHDHDKKSPYAP
jgi:hypothetical protein